MAYSACCCFRSSCYTVLPPLLPLLAVAVAIANAIAIAIAIAIAVAVATVSFAATIS